MWSALKDEATCFCTLQMGVRHNAKSTTARKKPEQNSLDNIKYFKVLSDVVHVLIDWRSSCEVQVSFSATVAGKHQYREIKFFKKGNDMVIHIHELINPLLLMLVSEDSVSLSS